MLNKVNTFINSQGLFTPKDRILVAISGGKDSVALAHILKYLGYSIALAHCNFQLRGTESDEDEKFVREWANQEQLPLFVKHFNTQEYAQKEKLSIQESARALRYNWFENLRKTEQFDYIAVAHHQQDVIETFFINLIRGTGIEGLCSIKAQNKRIIRPLLNVSLDDIKTYIKQYQIPYRNDSSNASVKYLRNKIRHQLMPQFREISAHFDSTMIKNIERLNQVNQIYKSEIQNTIQSFVQEDKKTQLIDIKALKALKLPFLYLYELLKPYGFSSSVIEDVSNSLSSESGKEFFSSNFYLLKDRKQLMLKERTCFSSKSDDNIKISASDTVIKRPIQLNIKTQVIDSNFQIERNSNIGYLDFDKLHFPLTLRLWQQGDSMSPLGMHNRSKKISDILIDLKISRFEKDNIYVLESKNEIVWLVGLRISDRFKIDSNSQKAFIIDLV